MCVYLRATRKKRYRRSGRAGEPGLGCRQLPLPDELSDRATVEPLAGGEVVTVRPAGGCDRPGALVYLHGSAFVNGIQPQHWTLVAHLADTTPQEEHAVATRWRPRTT